MSKVQKKKASEKELTKRREMKKLSMRCAREKLRQENIDKYEEIKKQDREHKRATRKKVAQMTDRERRQIQKEWHERARRYRQRKKEEAQQCAVFFTPPDSPLPDQPIVHSTSRIDSGRKTRRRNRELLNKELMTLKQENEKLRKKADRYKKNITNKGQKVNRLILPQKK